MSLVQPLGDASLATMGSFFLLDRVSFETSTYLLAETRSSELQSKFLPHGIGHLLPQVHPVGSHGYTFYAQPC
jgi:hypothetical protein